MADMGSTLGANVIINTIAAVDHHCRIGNHVQVTPGIHLGGMVNVEEGAFLGIGVSVFPDLKIGTWSAVGAGAEVVDNVVPGATAMGAPAKEKRKN
jgi:UDP-perosamine 4-acetyltransferase